MRRESRQQIEQVVQLRYTPYYNDLDQYNATFYLWFSDLFEFLLEFSKFMGIHDQENHQRELTYGKKIKNKFGYFDIYYTYGNCKDLC